MRSFKSTGSPTPTTDLVNWASSLSQNTNTANIELMGNMINDAHRYLLEKYFFNEKDTTIPTVTQQQFYNLPYNYSILKTITITDGNLKWTPTEIFTREDWDRLNVFPYYSDIPSNFFIYNGQIGIWPIPSSSSNTITFNYKIRVPDLSFTDYSTGTVTTTNASTTITGSGTGFLANYLPSAGSVLNLNLWIRIPAPSGDGNWYQISSIESATSLTLVNTYQGGTKSGATYTIGQMPLLLEDYHDLLAYRPLTIYFNSINHDGEKLKVYQELYNEGIAKLDSYAGKKTVQVNLRNRINTTNPNAYPQSIGS